MVMPRLPNHNEWFMQRSALGVIDELHPSSIGEAALREGACEPLSVRDTRQMRQASKRARPRKEPEGLDKVLFVRANQELLDKLNLLVERRQRENPGVALSRADVARAILWDALRREALNER
jgi:hypothetical protein